MPDKTIKHFIFIRFFPYKTPVYPYDIFDVNFLSKQLVLAKANVLKSLENQTNKNFEIVFLANDRYFSETKYEFIFSTLRNSTKLPLKFIKIHQPENETGMYLLKKSEMPDLIKDAYDKYDFVIQSAMDFDDFIYKDAVAETQSKVNDCADILAYGYCKGYTYIRNELYSYRFLCNGLGHLAILQSLILKSAFAKKLPFVGVYSFVHTKFKIHLKNFLEKNGIEFSEKMFEQNTSTMAYIYFRHEFSHEHLKQNGISELKIPKKAPLTTKIVTKKQLEDEFGFYYDLKSIK